MTEPHSSRATLVVEKERVVPASLSLTIPMGDGQHYTLAFGGPTASDLLAQKALQRCVGLMNLGLEVEEANRRAQACPQPECLRPPALHLGGPYRCPHGNWMD
jgi:hypothetical protein